MSDFLLDKEEIKAVIKPKPVITDSDRRLIKAAAKKVMKELVKRGYLIENKDWRDFKKEVEDG